MSYRSLNVIKTKRYYLILPVFGILLFTVLYVAATFLYPGGSQTDIHSIGFSWSQNYWCNLLNEKAMNGAYNPARPLALTALFILCSSLAYFWYLYPLQLPLGEKHRILIQSSGILSMGTGMFVFTAPHDLTINIASFFGLVAMCGTFFTLYRWKWQRLLWLGFLNLLLVLLNNILYYGSGLLLYLPVVQKISFLSFLIWISLIDLKLFLLEPGQKGRRYPSDTASQI